MSVNVNFSVECFEIIDGLRSFVQLSSQNLELEFLNRGLSQEIHEELRTSEHLRLHNAEEEALEEPRFLRHLLLAVALLLVQFGQRRDYGLGEHPHQVFPQSIEVCVVTLYLPLERVSHHFEDKGRVVHKACHLTRDDLSASIQWIKIKVEIVLRNQADDVLVAI